MGKIYDLGIDVGSTTVKTVILDEGEFIYNKYERHFSKVRETVAEQLRAIRELYPEDRFRIAITGSLRQVGSLSCRRSFLLLSL